MRTKFGELMIVKEKPSGGGKDGGGDQKNHKSKYFGAGGIAKKTLKAKITRRMESVEPNDAKLAKPTDSYANRPLGRDKSAVFTRRHT